MKTIDFGFYIITYNFIIGVLLMISSEKLGAYAGYFMGSLKEKISRLARIGIFAFGACTAALTVFVYIAGYALKL
jgi:hypothetical protein